MQRSLVWKSLHYSFHTLQDGDHHSLLIDEETEAGEVKTLARHPTGSEKHWVANPELPGSAPGLVPPRFPSEVRALYHFQTAAWPGPRAARGTESWRWSRSQRGPMPVFAQALCSSSPSRAANTDVQLAFPFFSHSPPVAQSCLPNSTFLARTVGRQDQRGLGRASRLQRWP